MSLKLKIGGTEVYDERSNRFLIVDEMELEFEHSLWAISKWEQKYRKPFFGKDEKNTEETYDYLKCMLLTEDVDPGIVHKLNEGEIKAITDYINAPMTATWFTEREHKKSSQEIITAEIIYYWMTSLQIDFAWEKRHVNQLLTLVRVISEKNAPEKKMSRSELLRRNKSLNAQRRARTGSRG